MWGWPAGVFTETLALRPAQLLGRDPRRHPQASKCQPMGGHQRLQLRPCFPPGTPGEGKAEELPREWAVRSSGPPWVLWVQLPELGQGGQALSGHPRKMASM